MDAWATAADLARLYGVSKGTIYAWASQDHWRRTRSHPKRYHWEDAQDSYERRRGATMGNTRNLPPTRVAQPHTQAARYEVIVTSSLSSALPAAGRFVMSGGRSC